MAMSRPVIKLSTMNQAMQEKAIIISQEAVGVSNTEQEMASNIKKSFESIYANSACWHVFVGRNFGCYVSHEAKKFIYFYVGQMGVVIFATA